LIKKGMISNAMKKIASRSCLFFGLYVLFKLLESDRTTDTISQLFLLVIILLSSYCSAFSKKRLPKYPKCPECGRPGQVIYSMRNEPPRGHCNECDSYYSIKCDYNYDFNKFLKIFATLVIFCLIFSGWHYYLLSQIWTSVEKQAQIQVRPTIASDHVKDVGYIEYKSVKVALAKREQLIQWRIKIPRTNDSYWCTWESGFTDFEKGEGVLLIHLSPNADSDEWGGYIVGLHGDKRGKVAKVWAIDAEIMADSALDAFMY